MHSRSKRRCHVRRIRPAVRIYGALRILPETNYVADERDRAQATRRDLTRRGSDRPERGHRPVVPGRRLMPYDRNELGRGCGAVCNAGGPPAVRDRPHRADDRRVSGGCRMSDEILRDLAQRSGIAVEWQDYAGRSHVVAPPVLRRVLDALGLPAGSSRELSSSRRLLMKRTGLADLPPLVPAM